MMDETEPLNLLPRPRRFEPTGGWVKSLDPVEFRVDPGDVTQPQGYRLVLHGGSVTATAHDEAGLFYAKQTLRQLRGLPAVPCGVITDWPDLAVRGVMLDISRDRVPTMATLYRLVDELAGLKINQLQLYTEHTFAYAGHEAVWREASPMTGEQVRALDGYCRERFVELVPNQNSLGHMERWLKHPAYASLAELPGGDAPPTTLCPGDPGAIELVKGLLDQLLPNFTSRMVNVGGDEPVELEQATGRSGGEIERWGLGPVYLNYLLKLHTEISKGGRVMMCWSDILQNHPELIPRLPKDLVVAEWGYEAGHDFVTRCERLAEAGLGFYVCPGTSGWLSLVGRTPNMLGNLRRAAEAALRFGAEGYLITEWGDRGHPQPYVVSLPAYACGAALAWGVEANAALAEADVLAETLDRHVLLAEPGTAIALLRLGMAYTRLEREGVRVPMNGTPIGRLLVQLETDLSPYQPEWFVDAACSLAEDARVFGGMAIGRDDEALIHEEVRYAADLAILACHLAQAQLEYGAASADRLPAGVLGPLRYRLAGVLPAYRAAWLARSRPGGLADSVGHLSRVLG